MGGGIGFLLIIGLGLLILLTQATTNRERYNQNYEWLLIVNAVVAASLLITILWGMVRLLRRLRKGQFGSRLLVKLAAIFALVGVVPGVLIYVVSYQFVSRSIESWFDVKVEGALAAGLSLGRATLDSMSHDLNQKTRVASTALTDVSDAAAGILLERLREQLGATDVVLWTGNGRMVASAGSSRFQLRPDRPGTAQLREARLKGSVDWIEGLDESNPGGDSARIKVLVSVPQMSLALSDEPRLLQVTQDLSPTLVTNALQVLDPSTGTVLADADSHIKSEEGIHVIRLPEHYGNLSPILHVVPLQLLAYHTACALGTDVDKPRNLAKSVTVE